jgi:hypothetical protein
MAVSAGTTNWAEPSSSTGTSPITRTGAQFQWPNCRDQALPGNVTHGPDLAVQRPTYTCCAMRRYLT